MKKGMVNKFSVLVIGICSLFLFMPEVEAKEYYTDTIYDVVGENNRFSLEVGDVIYHYKDNVDYSRPYGTDLGQINIFIGEDFEDHYDDFSFVVRDDTSYTILSYEELTGNPLPSGKVVSIEGYIITDCSYTVLNVFYIIEDDVPKEVVYHNTFDVENSNPLTYYEGETDILLADISREGYRFLGWYTSPTFEEETRVTMISSDSPEVLELYARWEEIEEEEEEGNIFTNPETRTMLYVGIGITVVVVLGTVLVVLYRKKKKD